MRKTTCQFGILLALLVFTKLCEGQYTATDHPNIVVFLSDDQGWGDFSCNGNKNLSTPNIDSLANDGVLFENFYVCPVCSPTRAEFLTGRYHTRGNVFGVSRGNERLSLDEKTIADALKSAGYKTGCFGKWHNGMQYPYHPRGRGFDEFYGFCSGHWGHYFDTMMEHNGKLVKGSGYINDDVTNHAIEFIESNKTHPFFAYIPYNTPHWPPQVPDQYWQRFADKRLEYRHREPGKEDVNKTRCALAMVENIDWNVGRVLAKLEDLNLVENTIVIYFNDNGPNSARWNANVKGRKGSTDEGGVRSPLFVRWPKKIQNSGRRIDQICGAIDLLPTICAATGVAPVNKQLDGVSLLPILENKKKSLGPRMIFSHWGKRVSVRTQTYRMDNQEQLFDMVNDPGQTTNVAHKFQADTFQLRSALQRWKKENVDSLDRSPRPFTLGHPGFEFTQMPARDANATGNIKRSSRHPNCSYFTGWNSTEDHIEWPVNVPSDGTFEVELRYALAKEDVGVEIEVSCGDSILSNVIQVAHEPPVLGPAQDKFKRAESVVKDFRPLSLGKIQLKQGEQTLKLRSIKIPGQQSIEFRLLMFKRID